MCCDSCAHYIINRTKAFVGPVIGRTHDSLVSLINPQNSTATSTWMFFFFYSFWSLWRNGRYICHGRLEFLYSLDRLVSCLARLRSIWSRFSSNCSLRLLYTLYHLYQHWFCLSFWGYTYRNFKAGNERATNPLLTKSFWIVERILAGRGGHPSQWPRMMLSWE